MALLASSSLHSAPSAGSKGTPASSSLRKRGLANGTFSSPRLLGSPSLAGSVAFNDDEAERRRLRMETQMRAMLSPGCHTPRSAAASDSERSRALESGGSSLSNAQIADHYSSCIKLSTQNKITAKNAFGLHLIDYMLEVLRKRGDMTNFQVAGCTLDASAKIYAGRVDSIYNDAYKMLGGLGSATVGDGESESRGGEEGEGEAGEGAPRKRRGKKSSVQTIVKNLSSLDVSTFDLEFEVDPLFKKTSAAFDEGGVEGLLLTQLSVRDDGCELMLDGGQVPPSSSQAAPKERPVDVSDLKELLNLEKMLTLEICGTFSSFKFSQWDGTINPEDPWNLLTNEGSPHRHQYHAHQPIAPDYSMLHYPPPSTEDADDGYDDDDNGSHDATEEPLPLSEGAGPCPTSDLTVLGVCGDADPATVVHSVGSGGAGLAVLSGIGDGELCLSEALQPSEYSYFNPAVLSAWAGPRHWKLKPRKPEPQDKQPARGRKGRGKAKTFRVDLTAIPDSKLFATGKAATKLSKVTLSKMTVERSTLPSSSHSEDDSIHRLFTRPELRINRQKRVTGPLEEGFDGRWYDYGNPNDNANYCPPSQAQDWDGSDGEEEAVGGSFSQPLNDTVANDYSQPDTATVPGAHPPDPLVLAGENLVAQPRTVRQTTIEYARTAKKINVKKLKEKMWDIISESRAREEGEAGLCFTDLCSELPNRIPSQLAKDATVPINFVCLLHLANEKNLRLLGTEDLSDVKIDTEQ